MSSVTFLASAVLTICVLHAVDQNMEDAVQKIGRNVDEKSEINQSDSMRVKQIVKPEDAQAFTPNAQIFNPKKIEALIPDSETKQNVVAKNNNAI